MKNYLNFSLTGKKLLPIWILFLLIFMAPYLIMVYKLSNMQPAEKSMLLILPFFILLIIIALVVSYYIAKLSIENVVYKEKAIVFNGSFGKYIGTVLLGLLLTIVTLGIYLAWFIRNYHRFFVNNASFDSQNFQFHGKGGNLFLILLLSIFLPIVILSIIIGVIVVKNPDQALLIYKVFQLVILIVMIPYIYFIYKWMINISYKDYKFSWETNTWASCGKIALEILLSIITLGIYMPLAIVKLYKYFIDKTVAVSLNNKYKCGYDIEYSKDFLYIWGQILLTIITLGVYYAWAYCNIYQRLLSKTYLEKN